MSATGTAGRGSRLAMAVCFLVAAVEGYDLQGFGIAAPKLVAALGLAPDQQGWAASIAMMGLVLGAVGGGWLADRIGRKPVLVGSVAAFGLFSLATALSTSYESLLLVRFACGLGFGGALPNLIATVSEMARPERRNGTVAAILCGMPAGGTAVSLLARLGGEGLSWQMIFITGGIGPLLLLPLVLMFVPESRPQTSPHADRNLAHALFAERRASPTLLLWSSTLLTQVILYLALNWLPTLVIARGNTPETAFAASMAFNALGVVGALIVGPTTDRPNWRWGMLAVYLGLAGVLVGLALVETPAAVIAASGALGFLVNGGVFSLYGLAPTYYPPQLRAAGAGAAVAVGRFGSIAGPIIAGQLRTAGATPGEVFTAIAPVAVAAALTFFGLGVLGRPNKG